MAALTGKVAQLAAERRQVRYLALEAAGAICSRVSATPSTGMRMRRSGARGEAS
jgi:hypothetical protein